MFASYLGNHDLFVRIAGKFCKLYWTSTLGC